MDFPEKDGGIWFSTALEHVRDGLIGVDKAGEIVWMNPAAERLIGRRQRRVAGQPVSGLFDSLEGKGRNPLGASVKTVLKNGTTAQISQHELICQGSSPVCVDYTIAPVFQGGECRGAVIVLSRHALFDTSDAGDRLKKQGEKPPRCGPDDLGRILVMDDDDVVRNLTVQKLIRLGYDSEGASNGEEAVRKFQAARDSGEPFDVVVLDLIVRDGMGGKGTFEALRDIDPGVRAILTSGHAADPVLTNFWEYGFFGVIRKPFVIKELDVAIRQALEAE